MKKIKHLVLKIIKNPLNIFMMPYWLYKAAKFSLFKKRYKKDEAMFNENASISNPHIKAAVIMDDFTFHCFKYECKLIKIYKRTFKKEILKKKPDFLFVESAWRGNDNEWRNNIINTTYSDRKKLFELLDFCKANSIPTAFWNKEDPVHFDTFIDTAKRFDTIFTTSEEMVEKYKNICGHEKVYPLMFAAQPKIHNPLREEKESLNNICFSGTYYKYQYEDRANYLEIFADAAIPYGLDIYDRMSKNKDKDYTFPKRFNKYIKNAVDYNEMVRLYKRYHVFININTVAESKTMFSRRIFELLACQTCVLSSPSTGMEQLFGGIVGVAETGEQASRFYEKAIHDESFRTRLNLKGFREIAEHHTCRHRLYQLCEKIGLRTEKIIKSSVSVISVVYNEAHLENVFNNFVLQKAGDKELIVVLCGKAMDNQEAWIKKAAQYPEEQIRFIYESNDAAMVKSLETGCNAAANDYIVIFNERDYYAPMYLNDLLAYTDFTDSQVIGKASHYLFDEETETLFYANPGNENTECEPISSAFMIKKEAYEKIKNDLIDGADVISAAKKAGCRFYACDRYNYLKIAHEKDKTLFQKCMSNSNIDECKKYITE